MHRKSVKTSGNENESDNTRLCTNGINDAKEACPTANGILSRYNGQSKICTHLGCDRVTSKKNLCEKHYRQEWRKNNKDHNKQYAANYHQKVRKPILQTLHKPKEKQCPRCNKAFIRTGANQSYCSFKCRDRVAYLNNREEILKDKAIIYKQNKVSINEQKKLYKREQRKNPYFKLKDNLRSRLNKAIKGNYKSGSAVKDLGCSIDELKTHLESLFEPGMTWDNYGSYWQIDHKEPLFKFDLANPDQLKEACNYKNLQPLTKEEHKLKSAIEQSMRE